jgi:hypothetical protein
MAAVNDRVDLRGKEGKGLPVENRHLNHWNTDRGKLEGLL